MLSAAILSSLDTTQDPCENFYEYASRYLSRFLVSNSLIHVHTQLVGGARLILSLQIRVASALSTFFSRRTSRS